MILPKGGFIYLIAGTMYAGKTTELIRMLKRFKYADYNILLFTLDSRFHKKSQSHDGISIDSHYVEAEDRRRPESIYAIVKELNADVVGFDEIQFLSKDYVGLFKQLALEGKKVILAGLEQDFRCNPFETTMFSVLEAEYVKKLTAVCSCGNPAIRNYRKVDNNDVELEGAEDIYEAKCRECYERLVNEES